MKLPSLIVLTLLLNLTSEAQTKSKAIKLISWSSEPCENTYDPYRLKSRISNIRQTENTTFITINFSDNCCATFKPLIIFNDDKLFLLPYKEYTGDYCNCNCCFSIEYEISGINFKNYKIFFKDTEVIKTENYYDTIKVSYEDHNGKIINRLNKFGFKEGKWITFYDDGRKEKTVSQYAESSLFFDSPPIWTKGYYKSGNISFYERRDTTESWFEDGELKSVFIKYKNGDTLFKKGFQKFENKQLNREYFERMYPTVFTSEFDPNYRDSGAINEVVYKREFYSNGNPKFISGIDTSFSWFEDGQLKSKSYKDGKVEFDSNGFIRRQTYSWYEKGPENWRNLENTLFVEYFPNGNIKIMELVRDEPTHDGIAPGKRYLWEWDIEMKLIDYPKNWKEPLPWLNFKDIKLKPKMLTEKSNKRNT